VIVGECVIVGIDSNNGGVGGVCGVGRVAEDVFVIICDIFVIVGEASNCLVCGIAAVWRISIVPIFGTVGGVLASEELGWSNKWEDDK